MITIALLVALFFVIAALCFFDEVKDKYVFLIYVGAALLMFCMAGFKPMGLDRDAEVYLSYYYFTSVAVDVEPTFVAIAALARTLFDSPAFVFVAYALLSVSIRAYGITRVTNLWLISMLVWLSNFYILQDLTQIRAAVATAIFTCSLFFLQKGERYKYLCLVALATAFHYSAMLYALIVFLGNKPLGRIWRAILIALPLIGFAMAALKIDPIVYIPIPYIQERVEIYEDARDVINSDMADINVFNIVYLIKIAMYYILLWKEKVISQYVPNFPLFIKVFALSIIIFTMFSSLPVFAFRASEMFGVVEILIIPYLVYTVKPIIWGKVIVVCYATVIFLTNLLYNQVLTAV